MADIFDQIILCEKCRIPMDSTLIRRNGFNLRAKKCPKCGSVIVHPQDKLEYEDYMKLKQKEFNVKMRMVGNSYAVSIPREIVDFIKENEKMVNDMVKLSFQEMGKLSLNFNIPEPTQNQRVIKTREIKIVKNNKPVFHTREFVDSAHPERNKKEVLKDEE